MKSSNSFIKRKKTRKTHIGKLIVGGSAPLRIKGMLKTSTGNFDKLLKEAKRLQREGIEALRVAVKEKRDIPLVLKLKKKGVNIPLVADIHFNYRLALSAIEKGFDGIRLNPANIYKIGEVNQIVKEAKKAGISIRIGVNSGGFKSDFSNPRQLADTMVLSAVKYIKIFEKKGFFDIMVSFKAADVQSTVLANRKFSRFFNYPLHLGITATGPFPDAAVKSSLGVGLLLSEGIGDIIRVSLTAPSYEEVRLARRIVQFLGIGKFIPEIISCPTCSRCEVDLVRIVNKFKKELNKCQFKNFFPKIAIMGCVVNGPGEASQADIGVAFGRDKAVIFKKGKILGVTSENKVINDLLSKLEGGL